MTKTSPEGSPLHAIADIERDTGLSKDTLRVWERRYGFPLPQRDAFGERRYDDATLLRLRHVRRLIDAGYRPGQVVSQPLEQLLALEAAPSGRSRRSRTAAPAQAASPAPGAAPDLSTQWLGLLQSHDLHALRTAMQQYLAKHGLADLLRHGVAPMNALVGQSWLEGRLAIFEEHLYAEAVQALLRQAMARAAATRPAQPPRVLITTVPGEPHSLGVLMAECMMVLEGCETLALGVQTPVPDIASAARACRADIVALGFSAVLNPRDVLTALAQMQAHLPPGVELWTGGRCPVLMPRRGRQTPVVGQSDQPHTHMASLDDIRHAVTHWRQRQLAGQSHMQTPIP